jgi:signal transduction histidine kinase
MLFQLHRSTISSSLFRSTIITSFLFLALVLAIGWSAVLVLNWQKMNEGKELLSEELLLIEKTLDNRGIDALIESLDYGAGPIWSDEQAYDVIEGEDFLIRLIDAEETIAGFEGIDAEFGWSTQHIELDEGDDWSLYLVREELDDDLNVIVGLAMDEEIFVVKELAINSSLILVIFWIPASMFLGFWLSRMAYGKLKVIADIANQVAQASLGTRAPIKGDDEFAQLSMIFNQMLDRIEVLARNLESVSIGVAHDLRTPISNLGGRLQLIERDLNNPQAIQQHISVSQEHIDTLLRTLEALLRLGDLEAGKRRSEFSDVDLSSLVMDLAESYEPVFADADKKLTVSAQKGAFTQGDRELLTQMLINLLENIVEHSRDGAEGWMSIQIGKAHVSIVVGDDGPGIPSSRTEQVFERFFRGDASRQTKGNGLGLSLVKAIAELHGGKVALVSVSPGAQFEITLPKA